MKGSCLCGSVRYEVTGDVRRFVHCHCSRCRKATGTGHASNVFLQPGTLRWLSGEAHVRVFKLPQAQRFANSFCEVCGGRLPRRLGSDDAIFVPAGSLDDVPAMRPQARIFGGSRAPWSCADDGLPMHDEYPPS